MTKPKVQKVYRNPIYTALEWKELLDSGKFGSKAKLGRHLGVSRVRVVQMLNLLKLDPEVISKLKEVGETFNKKTWGEKTLRSLVCLPTAKQIEKINLIKL